MRMKKRIFWLFLFAVILAPHPAMAKSRQPKTFPIRITVDFGPAGKEGVTDKVLFIEKNTTPKEAVSQVFPVLSGKACCSLKDVIGIGNVDIDPAKNRWWYCELNGSMKVSPNKTKLKRGDHLKWYYRQDEQ